MQIAQGKSPVGIYHSKKRLIEIVHETFDRFFPGKKIKVHPIEHVQSPVEKVDIAWINDRMLKTSTKLKQIADETGIDYTNLSTVLNGSRPLSQQMKALFYYYFLAKD